MKMSALENKKPCNDSIQDSNNRFTEIAWRLPHQRSTKNDQSNTRSHPNSI